MPCWQPRPACAAKEGDFYYKAGDLDCYDCVKVHKMDWMPFAERAACLAETCTLAKNLVNNWFPQAVKTKWIDICGGDLGMMVESLNSLVTRARDIGLRSLMREFNEETGGPECVIKLSAEQSGSSSSKDAEPDIKGRNDKSVEDTFLFLYRCVTDVCFSTEYLASRFSFVCNLASRFVCNLASRFFFFFALLIRLLFDRKPCFLLRLQSCFAQVPYFVGCAPGGIQAHRGQDSGPARAQGLARDVHHPQARQEQALRTLRRVTSRPRTQILSDVESASLRAKPCDERYEPRTYSHRVLVSEC